MMMCSKMNSETELSLVTCEKLHNLYVFLHNMLFQNHEDFISFKTLNGFIYNEF